MRNLIFLLGIVGAVWATSAGTAKKDLGATYFTGEELLNQCKKNSGEKSFCQGYIRGVADGFIMLGILESQGYDFQGVCIPVDISNGAIVEIVVDNLRENSSNLTLPAADFAYPALLGSFPCAALEASP